MNKIITKLKTTSNDNKTIVYNVIGAFIIKGLALFISLALTPTYIKFFNNEYTLGLWFTINSVLSWMLNFDLGIGNGLRNYLTKSYTEHDYDESKRLLSSSYFAIAFVCLFVSVAFCFIAQVVNWNKVFNVSEDIVSNSSMKVALLIVISGIMMQLFFKLINSVLYAIQKSAINNFLSLCTSILMLVGVSIAPSGGNDQNLIVMALIHICSVNIPLIVATIIVFTKTSLKNSVPSVHCFSIKHAKNVLSLGGLFLFVQIEYMVIMSTNELLINTLVNNEAVVQYQLYYKPFSIAGMLFTLALTPIWSAVTKGLTQNNYRWISRLHNRLLGLASICFVGCFAVTPFLQIFMNIWLGNGYITVDYSYTIAFCLLSGSMMLNSVMSSFANGIGELHTQIIFFGIGAILKVPLSSILVDVFHSWIGVVWANVACMGLYCVVQPFVFKRILEKKILQAKK